MKAVAADYFGTFALVFAGTGAIVIDDVSGGKVTHVGVALTFGLVVLAMIYALGDSSGAHLNPAVTLGFLLARRFPARRVPPYVLSHCIGALVASGCLRLMFPGNLSLGGTQPTGPPMQSFSLEVVLTLILIFVILSVARVKGFDWHLFHHPADLVWIQGQG
jgi:aquaporin Z